MEGDDPDPEAKSFHRRLAKIREKIFRNEEAGLCLEGFLDALGAGQDDGAAAGEAAASGSKFMTPVRSAVSAALTGLTGSPASAAGVGCCVAKDADARIKSDLAEYRALMVNRGDFEEVAVLGHGQFAAVSLVRERTASARGKVYAMKKMSKSGVSAAKARLERTVMSKAKSDWHVKLRFAFQDARFLYLVMEYCPGGDLRALLDRHDGKFSESMTRFYMAEMTMAIHSLHLMGYVHRDIKPENVLLDRFGHIKLADFGSAELISSKGRNGDKRPVGTPNYVSPEILQCLDTNRAEEFDPRKSDYWSLGVVGFEMMTGRTPFADDRNSVVATYSNIMSNNYRGVQLSGDFKELTQGLLTDVDKRWGYDQLVRHEFFISVDWDGLCSSCAPFVPDIKDCFDTSNFEVEGGFHGRGAAHPALANAKPSEPVVGFSYAGKHSESVRYSRQFGGDDYSDMVSSLRRQNEDLRLKVARLEKEKTKERRESAAKLAIEVDKRGQEEAKELRATVKELERLLEVERQERKQTESKSLELLSEVRKKWEAREEARLVKMEGELKKTRAHSETVEQELRKALDLAESQKVEINELKDVKNRLKNRLKECKSKLEVTFGKFEEESQKVKDLKEQSSLLVEASNRSAELEKSVLSHELMTERDKLCGLERELVGVKKELEKFKSVDRDQKETLQFLKTEKELSESEYAAKLGALTKERDALREERERLRGKVVRLEGECETAALKMRDKDAKLEELGKLLERLESKIKPIDKLPTTTTVSPCECKEEMKLLKDELKRLRQNLKTAEEELSLKKVDARILERKNKDLEERIRWRVEMARDEKAEKQKLEAEAAEAKTKVRDLEKEMEKTKADAEKATSRSALLDEEVSSLRKTVASLRLKEDEAKQTGSRLEMAERKLSQAESAAKKCDDLTQSNAKLKATCLELQDQCAEYESALDKVQNKLASEREQRERFQAEAAEQSKLVTELRIERNELKSRLAFAESRGKELQSKQEDVESAFRREEAEWRERLDKAVGVRSEQEVALRRLRDQLDHLAREGEHSGREARDMREQNLQLKEEMSELTTGMHSLKESNLKLNAVVEESLRKIERRNGEIAALREQVSRLGDEKERRENENAVHIEQLRKLIDHLRGKNSALEAQLYGKKSSKKRPQETQQLPVPEDELLLMLTPGRSRSRSPLKTPRNNAAGRSPAKSPPRKAFR